MSETPNLVHFGWHAECDRCGEVFVPDGPDDVIHIQRWDGIECGGQASELYELLTKAADDLD